MQKNPLLHRVESTVNPARLRQLVLHSVSDRRFVYLIKAARIRPLGLRAELSADWLVG